MLASDTRTLKVTLISCGELPATAEAMRTVAVYVPGAIGEPEVPLFAVSVTSAGAVVVLSDAVSHPLLGAGPA